ncbi:MAG: CRISPR-associated endonuclease Cas1, partial [Anaerovoracaceae bacterium]
MSYLYVRENGAQISINGGYFVVLQKDGLERKIPKETLESISIFGNVTITSQCIKELLRRGIPVSYFSPGGQYFGRLQSTRHINVLRQKQQFACCADNMFSLKLSRGIIEAKISNQFILLERYIKEKTERINRNLVLMKRYREKVRHVENLNELIGFEGLAARTYFEIISELVDEEFKFSGRSRRPPKDPFNAMISLGYTLIMYEVYSALENKSLNPYAGFLHQDH